MSEDLIIHSTDWFPLVDIPSGSTKKSEAFWEEYPSEAGVYLVAKRDDVDQIDRDLINQKIGYIGMSESLPYRAYSLRTSSHTAGSYIKSQGWTNSEVYVRILFTEEGKAKNLEDWLHDNNKKEFGHRFSWKAASSGNDGNLTKIMDMLQKLSVQETKELYVNVREHLGNLLIERELS